MPGLIFAVIALVACAGCRQVLGIDEDVRFAGPDPTVALGRKHSCALRDDGMVACWGTNAVAQLGDGTAPMDHPIPTDNGVTAIDVAAGEFHSCALLPGGGVTCWGDNVNGQLGTGDAQPRPLPTEVLSASDIVELVAGNDHTCGRLADGRVMCTGVALAAGGTVDRLGLELVAGIDDAVEIVAGSNYTCARRATDQVACWGVNTFGILGNDGQGSPVPEVIPTIKDAIEIAAGNNHACALHATGAVSCWGRNRDGNLGNGALEDSPLPVPVTGIRGAIEIAAGDFYSCARVGATEIRCWGANTAYQLGSPTAEVPRSLEPVPVVGLPAIAHLWSGGSHSCVRTVAGKLMCWGENSVGQLGDNTTTSRPTPIAVEEYP
jgi:alpha-tubulin suppressor-like RCC1 family protein